MLTEEGKAEIKQRSDAYPDWEDTVPICVDTCHHHDGKRCDLMGFRPGRICEPIIEFALQEMTYDSPEDWVSADRVVFVGEEL